MYMRQLEAMKKTVLPRFVLAWRRRPASLSELSAPSPPPAPFVCSDGAFSVAGEKNCSGAIFVFSPVNTGQNRKKDSTKAVPFSSPLLARFRYAWRYFRATNRRQRQENRQSRAPQSAELPRVQKTRAETARTPSRRCARCSAASPRLSTESSSA